MNIDDNFIALCKLTEEDPQIRKVVARVIELPVTERGGVIENLVANFTQSGAPIDLIHLF